MPLRALIYILACLLVPAIWGWLASTLYDRIHARRAKPEPDSDSSGEMYYI